MTELNREMVEKVCRALCLHRGQDPDEMIQAGNPIGEPADYPAWMFGMTEVRTILTAILPDLREQHYAECRRTALEEAEKAASGPYASQSRYHEDSPFYGSDLCPDRSPFGRGQQAGREAAAKAIRALINKEPT